MGPVKTESSEKSELVLGTLKTMGIIAAAMAGAAYALGFRGAAAGIAAGVPVGVFNYWLLAEVVYAPREKYSPTKAQAIMMRRALIRMGIDLAALMAAVWFGVEFLIGVAIGLSSSMFAYLHDCVRILARKGVKLSGR